MPNRVKPADADLMAPGVEYCYIYVRVDTEPGTLDADITYFDLHDSKTEYHNRITGVQLREIITSLTDEGWTVMHTEAGREQEEHYLQRRKMQPLTPASTQTFFAASAVEEAPPADTASSQVRPGDRHLMQAGMEYCYIYCAISLTTFTAEVNITIFDMEKTKTETRSIRQGEIQGVVAGYINSGWMRTHQEIGSGYEAYYLRRQQR